MQEKNKLTYKSKLDRLIEKEKRPEDIVKYVERVAAGGDPWKYESYSGSSSPQDPEFFQKKLPVKKLRSKKHLRCLQLEVGRSQNSL